MENFLLSINVVLPLFMPIVLGYILKKLKFYDEYILKAMNKLVFKVFLPVLLFVNVYNTTLKDSLNTSLMLYAVVCLCIIYFGTWLIVHFTEKEDKNRSVIIQGIYRSNFILFGIPVTSALFQEKGVGVVTMLIAIIVPLYNVFAVIILEVYRGGKIDVNKVIRGVLCNPLIIGSMTGILFLLFGIKLPSFLEKTTVDISKAATPIALIVLGGTFRFSAVRGCLKELLAAVLGRNLIVPVIFVFTSVMIGYRGVELSALVSMFTAPTAVSSFTMAEQMDANGELAGQIVVFTSIFSSLTIFFTVFVIKAMNFI
ncbi:MAG: AEC family transporter [Clostridiaceae bacterium]